jgi:hypothetical protein
MSEGVYGNWNNDNKNGAIMMRQCPESRFMKNCMSGPVLGFVHISPPEIVSICL